MVFAVLLFGNVTPLIFCCCFSIVNTAITTLAANGASFADNNIDDVVSVLQRNNDIDNSNVSANSFENKKLQNASPLEKRPSHIQFMSQLLAPAIAESRTSRAVAHTPVRHPLRQTAHKGTLTRPASQHGGGVHSISSSSPVTSSSQAVVGDRQPAVNESALTSAQSVARRRQNVALVRLTRYILSPERYDVRVRPVTNHFHTLRVHLRMSMYQIIEVDERAQLIKFNVWMIQKWHDESLDWNPADYDGISTVVLPHEVLWVPDTYLYNSVVMTADETERYMHVRADSMRPAGKRGANMSLMYPAIYTANCRLNVRYFPYDQQNCTLTIGSWTYDKLAVDYSADEYVNLVTSIPNEEWDVVSFRIFRHEYKYACCANPWAALEASLVLRRKPLYYIINLIVPTSIITLVAVVGFFTPSSTTDDREEKINLGITTLLAKSILLLMVSDQMPTTSEFVPLMAWFYLSIIIIVSLATILTTVVLAIQSRRQYGVLPSLAIRHFFFVQLAKWLYFSTPPQLAIIWEELDDHPFFARQRHVLQKREEACRRFERKLYRRWESRAETQLILQELNLRVEDIVAYCETAILPEPSKKRSDASVAGQHKTSSATADDRPPSRKTSRNSLAPFAANRVPCNASFSIVEIAAPPPPPSLWRRVADVFAAQRRLNWRGAEKATDHADEKPPLANGSAQRHPPADGAPPPVPPRGPPAILAFLYNPPPPRPPKTNVKSMSAPPSSDTVRRAVPPVTDERQGCTTSATSPPQSPPPTATRLSGHVAEMRRRRQCTLEWEYLATILDQIFLIVFTTSIVILTLGLMITGWMTQYSYDQQV